MKTLQKLTLLRNKELTVPEMKNIAGGRDVSVYCCNGDTENCCGLYDKDNIPEECGEEDCRM